MAAQADLLAFADAFGDFYLQGFALVGHLAARAEGGHIEAERAFAAGVGRGEVDRQLGVLVFAGDGAGLALAACAGVAEGGEDVVETEVAAAEGLAFAEAAAVEVVVLPEVLAGVETARAAVGAAGAAEGVGQHFIVFGAFGLVFHGVVGEVDFAGFLVGIGVFADIGVVLAHQLAVGLFDVGQAGIFGHAEDVVVGFLVGTHILDILWNG